MSTLLLCLCLSHLLCLAKQYTYQNTVLLLERPKRDALNQIQCIYWQNVSTNTKSIHREDTTHRKVTHVPPHLASTKPHCIYYNTVHFPGHMPQHDPLHVAVLTASAPAPVTTPRTPPAPAVTWPSPSMSLSPRAQSWRPTHSPTSSPSTASPTSRSSLWAATTPLTHAMPGAAVTRPPVDGPLIRTALESRKASSSSDGYLSGISVLPRHTTKVCLY